MPAKSTKLSKSTKIAKVALKSATGGLDGSSKDSAYRTKLVSGRGTSNNAGAKGKAVTLAAKARELKIDLKAVSGRGTGATPTLDGKLVKGTKTSLTPISAKSISGRGGKECLIQEEKIGGSIKVKADRANLKKSLKN